MDAVAARLDVNPETVRRRVNRGELPALRLCSGPRAPIRVDADALEAFIRRNPEGKP